MRGGYRILKLLLAAGLDMLKYIIVTDILHTIQELSYTTYESSASLMFVVLGNFRGCTVSKLISGVFGGFAVRLEEPVMKTSKSQRNASGSRLS